jgi:single-stranded-DNA-specific exonuclease
MNTKINKFSDIWQQIWSNRGILDLDETQYSANKLLHFKDLAGVEKAAQRIYQAITNQESICIVGDYDADGATATTIIVKFFKAINCPINYFVPNRLEDGYGLTSDIVDKIAPCNLIITVDNGITSIEGVSYAKSKNIDVIITDHHLALKQLPDAIIVNPNQEHCTFKSKSIAGVGVAFYLLLALRYVLKQNSGINVNMMQFLDLVALGTIADVVKLDYNNRILVQLGINLIRNNKASSGLKTLMDLSNLDCTMATATDLAFKIAPKLNAAGRLEDMSIGIKCLLNHENNSMVYANSLININKNRQQIQTNIVQEAETLLQKEKIINSICLYHKDWHEGVNGIVASKIKEQYHVPVFIFTKAADGFIKGSARSVLGIHLKDVLQYIADTDDTIIEKFGGHAMACGLTLKDNSIKPFANALTKTLIKLNLISTAQETLIDAELDYKTLDLNFCEAIYLGGPWGQGFLEPVFKSEFVVEDYKILKELHTKLVLKDEHIYVDAIGFNKVIDDLCIGQSILLTYKLSINNFNGKKTQLIIEDYEY